jgi:small-conductance mechanosensitive channel/CRP-like cAMP-binding protein
MRAMPWESMQDPIWYQKMGLWALVAVVLAVFIMRTAPSERRSTLRTLALFALSFVASLVGGLLILAGLEDAGIRTQRVATLVTGISIFLLAGAFVFRVVLSRLRFLPPRILQDVLVIIASLVWGLYLLHRDWSVDLTSILTTSAVITAVIGFSLQDTLGNILGGLALQLDQTVQVGDWIELDKDTVGKVVEIRWRQTSIETRDWETVVIPNSVLMKNRLVVIGRRIGQPTQQRQWISFHVATKYPPSLVIETVNAALRGADIPHVAKLPKPTCLLVELAESSPQYSVAYWLTDQGALNPTNSDVRVHIVSALSRAGIPTALPSQSIFLSQEPDTREMDLDRELRRRVATLNGIDLFDGFGDSELHILAERLVPTPFSTGDVLTKQGATADWLYIVANGKADVYVERGRSGRAKVAEIGPGTLCGEMGLMTGEPRAATVIARTHMDCYRLDKESFRDLLASRPDVADQISALLAKRRAQIDATIKNLDERAQAAWTASTRNDIRRTIQHFFGLAD